MGGRVVYLMAAANPVFKAAVAYYRRQYFSRLGTGLPSPFERTAEIHCPLQGHFGAEDKNPSPEDMAKLDTELNKFQKPHEFLSYPNAGHGFMDSTKESYRGPADEAILAANSRFFGPALDGVINPRHQTKKLSRA